MIRVATPASIPHDCQRREPRCCLQRILLAMTLTFRSTAVAGGLVGLDAPERDAVLAALEDDGGDPLLAELRAALMSDFEHRQRTG